MKATASRFYGRRKGRPLHVRKKQLMENLLPEIEINLKKLELPKKKSVWLEIGFGGGEHLAAQAAANPGLHFIGCEPFVNGVASLLDHIDRQQLKNIRVFPDDARHLLDALPDRSVEKCFVLFADPWPKKRHARRRFIGPDTLPRLARVMGRGGELRLATDDMQLAAWMKDSLAASPDFDLTREAHVPPADWVQTRYECKALQAGRKPVYLTYRRH